MNLDANVEDTTSKSNVSVMSTPYSEVFPMNIDLNDNEIIYDTDSNSACSSEDNDKVNYKVQIDLEIP